MFSFSGSFLRCPAFPLKAFPCSSRLPPWFSCSAWLTAVSPQALPGVGCVSGSQNTPWVLCPNVSEDPSLHNCDLLLSLVFFLTVALCPCIPQNAARCGLLRACPRLSRLRGISSFSPWISGIHTLSLQRRFFSNPLLSLQTPLMWARVSKADRWFCSISFENVFLLVFRHPPYL